ncbi:50S ribosomal protein L22 [Porphyromonas crevioricanis]|uniref:Large ribosomal subunit protein uL22 n=2 Tax=Porphyromonas crevioricanis TaxID=393921 RepID=A0A0A2FPD9_9PORP|nr:50S ribosomal protein L22 [Porphyromonas crevioricanis]KGN90149.1 50S ribosomal protein L22 [Porphyromonas crevioricanis]KGN94904.1 50S ribosomal protein L22 [Porphyromonas crevioricanis]SJZ81462.1 large subunit ribosomal protein L22 [Porphyromonas crevioricanis]SQH72545.1 50S ribosomal protein L22 [Porphyromonas crevioricanis]GAD05006.1 LSU ribosomal protein L22p [Porphyromonas crevioricanis JCM 15906]
MGARKRISAERRREALRAVSFAQLRNVPTSPRKMRYVADMVRGMEVDRALGVLRFSQKEAAARVEKLLRSAIANWEEKNQRKAEAGELYVSRITVDEGMMLKRLRPAPQGRGYRIRKRSNHVTLFVDAVSNNETNN